MFEVGAVEHFEAAHRLEGDFGPASRTHGHTYRVEIVLRGATLSDEGVLFDVGRLREATSTVVGRLHYQDLAEVEGLRGKNTTAEIVARHIFDELVAALDLPPGMSAAVRVWESPQVFAGYEAKPA